MKRETVLPAFLDQRTLHFRPGARRPELNAVPGFRVLKLQIRGMEEHGAQPLFHRRVQLIAKNRMADGGQVNPNLVSTPSLQPRCDQGPKIQPREFSNVGHRRFAIRIDGHSLTIVSVAGNRGVDRQSFSFEITGYDGHVPPFRRFCGELTGEMQMGAIRLGDDDQSGRVLVEPVDNPRAIGCGA